MPRLYNSAFVSVPARTLPHPWEDFASFVSRVAECMGYKNPQWILRPEESSSAVQPFNLCMLRKKKDYRFFEYLLQIDERAIYHLTLHRFTSCVQDPVISHAERSPDEIECLLLTHYTFQTFFNPYSATKICSACLAEEPTYGRLYWNILPVIACLRHNVLLVDRCPVCLCSIPLLRSSLTRCPKCNKGDYREVPLVPLPKDEFFKDGQMLVLRHLGIEDVGGGRGSGIRKESTPALFDLLPWHYFQLLDAFRCILGPLFPDAPFLRGSAETLALLHEHPRPHCTLSIVEWSVVISTFHWIFTAWPHNFFAFLDAFPHVKSSRVRKRDQDRMTGIQRDFGVFYEKWLYKRLTHPAFTFLHEAFEDYLRTHYVAGEVTRRLLPFKGKTEDQIQERPYLTKVQARALLGIGEDKLQSLLRQGILRAIKKPIGSAMKRHMFLIEKESVEALQQAWSELIPLNVLMQTHLGTTKAVVLALEDAGMLLPMRGPNSDGYKLRLYSQATIEQFKQTVLSHAIKLHEELAEVMIPLTVFASKAGVSLITLLKEILDGHLLPVETSEDQPLFQRLILSKGEIGRFLEEYKRRQRGEWDLLTPYEVAIDLGISERVLGRWVQWGLIDGEKLSIGGKKPSLLFRKFALEEFHRTYAFTEEVAELLRVTLHTVSRYVRRGKLSPVAGRRTQRGGTRLLFFREEVLNMILDTKEEFI
jgi:hypothetical protein